MLLVAWCQYGRDIATGGFILHPESPALLVPRPQWSTRKNWAVYWLSYIAVITL